MIIYRGSLFGQTPVINGEKFSLYVKNVMMDSLRKSINTKTGYTLFYKLDKGDDSLKFTLSCNEQNIIVKLKETIGSYGYTVSELGKWIFILKGVGIVSYLPEGYFTDKREAESLDQYLKAISEKETSASSENKIYKIGDPNMPKQGNRVTLTGYIRKLETGEPLAGVSVYTEKPNIAVTTDNFGFYRIVLPPGKIDLNLKGYGLDDSKLMLEVYGDGVLDILMKEKVYPLKGIVLTAESTQKLRSANLGLERVRIDRIKHVPAAFGEADVMKIVLILPGVKSVGEASGGFNVRGGASDQNLIIFNEGTMYNPSHLFGMFSAFNPDVVSDIELYKSSIPAKFGGRISSVLEINSRNGNSNKITGSAGIGLLTGKFHIEGPIVKNKTNFIAGVRSTYSNWLLRLLPEDSGYKNGTAGFNDLTFGLSHKINEKNSLYMYGYVSGDKFSFNRDTNYSYQTINASLKWRSQISDAHNFTLSSGYDQYSYNTRDSGNPVEAYTLNFKIRQMFLKGNFSLMLNEKHTLTYGIDNIFYLLNPGTFKPYGDASIQAPKELAAERAVESAVYVSDNWNINDKLSLDLGLRYGFFASLGPAKYYKYLTNERREDEITDTVNVASGGIVAFRHFPEIRLSARYSINENLTVKAGFNSMRQNIHLLSNTATVAPTDTWKLSDANIAPQNGWQAAAGLFSNSFGNKIELSVEAYYKAMNNYLDYKSSAQLNMNENIERDVLATNGKAFGFEFLAKKPMGKLNGWMSYTYSRTFLRESGKKEIYNINNGKWYPAAYDKPHDFKLIGNYKFTQRYSLSFNIDYSTGRPVTIPISRYYYGDGYRLYYSDRNAYRIPDYFRMDLAVNIEPSHYLKYWTYHTITLGVYNITGRKNAFSVYYDSNNGSSIKGYKLSIFGAPIPYITYNIKF
jgi:outer membrane receptor for ferrienterochelin and colicin